MGSWVPGECGAGFGGYLDHCLFMDPSLGYWRQGWTDQGPAWRPRSSPRPQQQLEGPCVGVTLALVPPASCLCVWPRRSWELMGSCLLDWEDPGVLICRVN